MPEDIEKESGLNKQTISNLKEMDFQCQRCSNCCRHDEGYVFLTKENALAIADHLKMTLKEFINQCCRIIDHPQGHVLCLKEKRNYDCIFWSNGCIIYEVRPTQCMTFPYWPFLVNDKKLQEEEKQRCKGLGVKGDHSLDYKIEMYRLEQESQYYIVEEKDLQ